MEESYLDQERYFEFRKSWTAYIAASLLFAFILGFVPMFFVFNPFFGVIYFLFIVTVYVTYFLTLKSYCLFANDTGVWVFKGIFPWSKGFSGIRWKDIDSAYFSRGFIHWLFKSYPIAISHKFTKASEISITHIKSGQIAVATINQLIVSKLSGNA